jgi:outer membrane protein assembly factor BamA
LQLDQGLGIGSKNPFFNRHQLTLTKFINLNKQEKGVGKPLPAVLVLHGHYAGCVGDLPSYDAFALGGPYSVRGFSNGELGASRNILEVCITHFRFSFDAFFFLKRAEELFIMVLIIDASSSSPSLVLS